MVEAVYAIDDFPADDLPWRIEWIGDVGYNPSTIMKHYQRVLEESLVRGVANWDAELVPKKEPGREAIAGKARRSVN